MTPLAAIRAIIALPFLANCATNAFSEEARLDCVVKNSIVLQNIVDPWCPPVAMCHPRVMGIDRRNGFDDFLDTNAEMRKSDDAEVHIERVLNSSWMSLPLSEREREAEYCRSRFK